MGKAALMRRGQSPNRDRFILHPVAQETSAAATGTTDIIILTEDIIILTERCEIVEVVGQVSGCAAKS